jgi:S-adenosylmethionine:tRNA ribosyltransferase-isomerase
MKLTDFDYHLPPERIAQIPVEPRDSSKLLVLHRQSGNISHFHFDNLPDFLEEGDLLVFNDSRVVPARLYGFKEGSGTKVELLLLRQIAPNVWESLVKPGKKLHEGARVRVTRTAADGTSKEAFVEIIGSGDEGIRTVRFNDGYSIDDIGLVPLPPYIHTPLDRPDRYQTVYARIKGSAAAPTAGLHFTERLLKELQQKGIRFAFVTLHIGLDTFRPVHEDNPENHKIHSETGELTPETAALINEVKRSGKKVIAVGTSTTRIVEAASQTGEVRPLSEDISLFILPGYKYRTVDRMITNFHLPKSTLIMLVSAFAGRELILKAYDEAVKSGYRFYSFGDAMLIE